VAHEFVNPSNKPIIKTFRTTNFISVSPATPTHTPLCIYPNKDYQTRNFCISTLSITWLTCLTCPPLLPTLAASTRPPVGGTPLNFLPAHGDRNIWEEKMMRTILLLVCYVALLCVSSPAAAQPRIVVTDSDCAHFPNGLGSGVMSGAMITLNTHLTVDSNGNDCIVIA
jgi:hypothetical protein